MRRFRYAAIAVMFWPACSGAAPTEGAAVSTVSDLASLLEGEFATDSTDAGPTDGKTYFESAKRVDVPALGHNVVYAELHEGGPAGKLLRQRLYALDAAGDNGAIEMTAYSFANGAQLAGADANRAPLAKLAPSDLKPAGCKISWRQTENGFEGSIPPLSCSGAPAKAASGDPAIMGVSKTALSMPVGSDSGLPSVTFRRVR